MKNGFFIWIGRIVLIVFIVFIIVSAIAFFQSSNKPPSIEKAPFIVQTYTTDEFRLPSRYYYGESLEYVNGNPVLKGSWWSFDGKNYHRHEGDITFSIEDYGKIDVIKRIKGGE